MIEKQVIRDFLAELANSDKPIGDNVSLLGAKLIDSLKVAELIVFLETHFEVVFDSEELIPDNFDTINAIVDLLEQKKG